MSGPWKNTLGGNSNEVTPSPVSQLLQFVVQNPLTPTGSSDRELTFLYSLQLLYHSLFPPALPPPALVVLAPLMLPGFTRRHPHLRLQNLGVQGFDPYDGDSWDLVDSIEGKEFRRFTYKCSYASCPRTKTVVVAYIGEHSHKRDDEEDDEEGHDQHEEATGAKRRRN